MQNKPRKILTIIAVTLIAAGTVLAAAPDQAVAKWAGWASHYTTKDTLPSSTQPGESIQAKSEAGRVDTDENDSENEAIVADQDGQAVRVKIEDTGIPAKAVVIEKEKAASLQDEVDNGRQPWLLDPIQVVKAYAEDYGFSLENDKLTLVSRVFRGAGSGTGEAAVLVQHGDKSYLVRLIQPAGPGTNSIWQINSIQEVKTVVRPAKPDVGPGVEGLDYSKVVKWQQSVDEGRELWRLDPMQVARMEGKNYGFNAEDTFTIVKELSSSPIARHGEVDVQVVHEGKHYLMVIVKPFGGEGAIWTTYRVEKATDGKPAPQPAGRILFQTDKFAGWDWYKKAYPQDMAFRVISDYSPFVQGDSSIPSSILARVKDVDYQGKVVLFAYMGTAGGADNIGIEKVTLQGNTVTVQVRTRSVKPGEMETKMITHPFDYVAIDRNAVDIWGGANIVFIDQQGRVLEKNRLSINHHK